MNCEFCSGETVGKKARKHHWLHGKPSPLGRIDPPALGSNDPVKERDQGSRFGSAMSTTRFGREEKDVLDVGTSAAGERQRGRKIQPCGCRSEGPSIRMVWHWWRSLLSRASTRPLLPRKFAHSS